MGLLTIKHGIPAIFGFTPEECKPRTHELVRKCVNEETDLSSCNRVVRVQVGEREEVGDEFEKDQGFSNLDGFRRRIGGVDLWPAIGNRRDLGML